MEGIFQFSFKKPNDQGVIVCQAKGIFHRHLNYSLAFLLAICAMPCERSMAASSKDSSMCGKVLQPDTVSFASDSRLQLAYLDTVSQEKYDTSKQEGSLNVLVPIQGIPVKIGANYGEFKTSLDDYKRSVNYQLNKSESILYYSSHLPAANVTGFVQCMRGQSSGLFLTPSGTPDGHGNVVLVVEWHPPAGVNRSIKLSFEPIINGMISGAAPVSLGVNSTKTFTVNRTDPKGALTVTVNGSVANGSYSDDFYDPEPPAPLPRYHYVTSAWHPMTATWSAALPDTTPDETCIEVSSEGTWSCHANTCPQSCDSGVGNRSVKRNVESSGAFDGPKDYGDNTGQCRYTFICTKNN